MDIMWHVFPIINDVKTSMVYFIAATVVGRSVQKVSIQY